MRRVPPILAAGLLFAASAASAAGLGLPRCVRKRRGRYIEPKTLTALLDCQRGKHASFSAAWRRAEGRQPPKRTLDRLQEMQQREVRNYLGRHPDRASTRDEDEEEYEPDPEPEEPSAAERITSDPEKDPDMAALTGTLKKSAKNGKGLQPSDFGAVRKMLRKTQGAPSSDMELLLQKLEKRQRMIQRSGRILELLNRDTRQGGRKGPGFNERLIEGSQ